ncbi:hypothetical protein BN2537_16597 [Streptomyces venezuelae]|nr:hypothetical protein BN2537_16597 [Streptomyces venezuelae]
MGRGPRQAGGSDQPRQSGRTRRQCAEDHCGLVEDANTTRNIRNVHERGYSSLGPRAMARGDLAQGRARMISGKGPKRSADTPQRS